MALVRRRPRRYSLALIRALPALVALILLVAPSSAFARPPQDVSAKAERLVVSAMRAKTRERRDEIWSELIALARDHEEVRPLVSAGLLEFWASANRRLNTGSTRRAFAALVESREELDELRAATLALVRDEDDYPYPFLAPAATEEEARSYRSAQRKIDGHVARMRVLWADGPSVRLTRDLRRGGERVLWAQDERERLAAEFGLEVALDTGDVAGWMHSLPVEQPDDAVDLTTFALTPLEADRVARDRAILARNAALFDALSQEAADDAERALIRRERQQVECTNDYRRMLGVPALAWNPRLHAAVRDHAGYLDRTGRLGHEQPGEEKATIQARAHHFGYPGLVWENCHRGSGTAQAAHATWIRSSAHHRTILNANLTEMATGSAGKTWVQKFGLDTAFESAIQCHPWRD